MPPKPFYVIKTITAADIDKTPVKAIPRDNLTWNEQKALNDIQQIDNRIITKANKGETVLIWSTDDYIIKANRQLNEISLYKKLDNDPTKSHVETIKRLIDKLLMN